MKLKNKILEAINRGISNALDFNLDDYNSDSNDLYISKKKINLNNEDKTSSINFYIKKLLNGKKISNDSKKLFLKLSETTYYDIEDDNEKLRNLVNAYCEQFGWESDLNWINTSRITDMSNLFKDSSFNGDISKWDTSNVTNMEGMFCFARQFNQDISSWDTSKVEDMHSMFFFAKRFNLPIGSWDVSNVEDMSYMFMDTDFFNLPIGEWNTANVKFMVGMFYHAYNFNLDISRWNVSNVEKYVNMFDYCFNMSAQFKPKLDYDSAR